MKKRLLSLALCLVLVVGLFSGLTVNASAGRIDDLKKEVAEKLIKKKIEQLKEEFEIPDLDMDAILSSFGTAATSGDFGENNCLHWEVSTGGLGGKTLTISGTGAMPDFDFPNGNLAPWWNYEALGMLTSFGNFKLEGELKKVVIKDGVTNVSNYALFFLPAATQITLPESVTSIGRYGIALCAKLKGISLPKAVTGIGDFGLAGNSFTAVTLPDGLQTLGRGAFDACASLSGMTLPAAITAVPDKCFNDCTKLLTVDYKGEVTAIGERAFEGCKSLTKAPIPAAVTALGNSAFNGCIALTDVTLPGGVTAELAGETTQVTEMLSQMAKMLALALAFVYFVMVAQFQSLLSPFIVLFTIPLAFTGGMLGLMAAGEQLSLISLMGFLVLMGVVVNNGIVFVDYANQLRIGGLERTDALVATGRTRMRPILMTTLTTVLAMVTMLFGTDMASEMSTGMAIVIIGGLSYATLMTLFVVPVLYDLFYRRPPVNIDVGDDGLDDLPDDAAEFAAEFAARRAAEAASAPRRPDLSRAARAPEENDGEKKEADHDNG